jgi:hypothetical protein
MQTHCLPSTSFALPAASASATGLQFTLFEIDFLSALAAHMCLVEFVGKDLLFRAAIGTVAGEGFQVLELLKSGTMLRCRHRHSPFSLLESFARFVPCTQDAPSF